MKDVNRLQKFNDGAVFLGCGPSINELDETFLDNKDIWANNNFILHPRIVPDFYHLELKEHRNGPMVRGLISDKRKEYSQTNWILNKDRPYLLNAVKPEWFNNIFQYSNIPVYCLSSVTIVLQIMISLGYEKIYFAGVDLNTSEYFWTDNSSYNVPEINNSCKPDERDKDSIHPTAEREVHKWIASMGMAGSTEFINISKGSLLETVIRSEY
jgi:hypothetical protein